VTTGTNGGAKSSYLYTARRLQIHSTAASEFRTNLGIRVARATSIGLEPKNAKVSQYRLLLSPADSRTWAFSVDLPANHLGPGWRHRAGASVWSKKPSR